MGDRKGVSREERDSGDTELGDRTADSGDRGLWGHKSRDYRGHHMTRRWGWGDWEQSDIGVQGVQA